MNRTTLVSVFAVVLLIVIGALALVLKPGAKDGERPTAATSPRANERSAALSPEKQAELRRTLEHASHELNQGSYRPAQRLLEDAKADFPRDQQLYALLHEAYVGQALWEPAYSAIQEAINIGPASAPMHDAAGLVANQAGYIEEAIQHYALAASLDPANPKYPLYRAQLLIKVGEYDQARRYLMQTINLDEDQEFAWGTLAQLSLRDNKPDMALQYLARAREINPKRPVWIIEESKAYRRKNEAERAVLFLSGLPQDVRDQPGVLEELSTGLAMLGRPGDAAEAWRDRSDRNPRDWYSAWQAAMWFERAGNLQQALRFAEIALVIGPDKSEPRELVERLTSAASVSSDGG